MSGVGRTGRFFAMEHYSVQPDLTVLSKGLSSGYAPLAAVISRQHVFETVRAAGSGEFVHGFTYSGNPVSAAVGLEVLGVLDEEKLIPHVARMGELLLQRLQPLRALPMVGDIRGKGLLIGIEFVADRTTRQPFAAELSVAARVRDACLAEGLYVYPSTGSLDGMAGDNILIAPPYIITEAHVDELVARLEKGVRSCLATLFTT